MQHACINNKQTTVTLAAHARRGLIRLNHHHTIEFNNNTRTNVINLIIIKSGASRGKLASTRSSMMELDQSTSSTSCSNQSQTKTVLVCFGEHKRQVSFPINESADLEKKSFVEAVHFEFTDVLPSPSPPLIIQLKNERWDGHFVDLSNKAIIPQHSVVRVIPEVDSAKVEISS